MRLSKSKILFLAFATVISLMMFAACTSPQQADPPPAPQPQPAQNNQADPTPAPAPEQPASDYPVRDINIVVPWGAGGGTDLTVRSLAAVMQREIGVNMPVLNQGGASGSVGMQEVYDSDRDGYRILGTSMSSITTVQVMGLADIHYTDWYAWNAAFTPNVIVVRGESPYQTIEDLANAMLASPNTITVGSAGPGSSGHIGAVAFANAIGASFNHIPYEGGNPAIIATLGGEVEFNAQLLNEMVDYIRSGELRALATMGFDEMILEAVDGSEIIIPAIGDFAPAIAPMLPLGGSFGIMVPRDTPSDIVATLDAAYSVAVRSSEFAAFAEDRGMVVNGYDTTRTDEYLSNNASRLTWLLADEGLTARSPEELNIPRP